jgi:hypothetical protein
MTFKRDGKISVDSDVNLQGDSNMTGTDLCVNKPHKSRSYLNHLVQCENINAMKDKLIGH